MNYKIKPSEISKTEITSKLKFLNLLAEKYPNIMAASSEIINLEAILNLPKGTEHFLSDIHGEYETFKHILSNGSGVIRRRLDDLYGEALTNKEKKQLSTLIYYPHLMLEKLSRKQKLTDEWYRTTLTRIIELARYISSKYTRSKVRKSMPKYFEYIIDELLNINDHLKNKKEYFDSILETIIEIEKADEFIISLSKLIQRLAVDHLHIVGDIYDRGPDPDKVMDELMKHHSVDIQWGNHDVVWMGAAAGIPVYMAIVLRISARYNTLDTIEESYGINLYPLYEFANEIYKDDPCKEFIVKTGGEISSKMAKTLKRVHKAISIIQFKLEGQIIKQNPQFGMDDRILLDVIDYKNGEISCGAKSLKLLDNNFPTIDPDDPLKLTEEEMEVMERLRNSFTKSEKLQRHVNFLFSNGSMYLNYNGLLLYHGAIPLDKEGNFASLKIEGKDYTGKALLDKFDQMARRAYYQRRDSVAQHYLWYLWCGPESPLYGKKKMATFERYFLEDKETHREDRNPYFDHRDNEAIMEKILEEFGLNPKRGHIVNGHVPVKVNKGESPLKANGKLIVIDGGMSKAYQSVTGIAGYTLIYNSYGLVLVAHQPFESKRKAVKSEMDISSSYEFLAKAPKRKQVADTDNGAKIKQNIYDIRMLLAAFMGGYIKEKF